jgi:hypothetical protein
MCTSHDHSCKCCTPVGTNSLAINKPLIRSKWPLDHVPTGRCELADKRALGKHWSGSVEVVFIVQEEIRDSRYIDFPMFRPDFGVEPWFSILWLPLRRFSRLPSFLVPLAPVRTCSTTGGSFSGEIR